MLVRLTGENTPALCRVGPKLKRLRASIALHRNRSPSCSRVLTAIGNWAAAAEAILARPCLPVLQPRAETHWNHELLVAAGCVEVQLPSPRIGPESGSTSHLLSLFRSFGHYGRTASGMIQTR